MKDDRFRPDAAARRVMPSGNRGDRVIIDDPHSKPGGVTEEERAKARAMFEDRGPLASVGRNSIPKSHRGEGVNYVD